MIEPATLEQIIGYMWDKNQEVIIRGKQTEELFTVNELLTLDIASQIYDADVIGIRIEGDYLVLSLDDSYGDIDALLEEYGGIR